MLKPISRLRSICKGDLNYSTYSNVIIHNRIRKKILHSIPVLSIFTLFGIITYTTIALPLTEPNDSVQAAEKVSNNTSLIIDNGDFVDNATAEGNIVYSSHTVQVKADNITKYTLTINGPVGLTGDTTITGADNKTLADMADNTWGYAWDNTTVAEEDMTYASFTGSNQTITKTTAATGATKNPSVPSSTHKVDFTRKLVFAAKFGSDAVSGHYNANVKLNLTITPMTLMVYSVHYDMNGGFGGPSSTNDTVSGTSYKYTIPQNYPIRPGYEFIGYNDNNESNGSDVQYQPGDTITINSTNRTTTLYAIWQQATAFPTSLTTMQGMTAAICKNAGIGATATLKDTRDSKTYTVQKLKDGNCWMTQNLALNLMTVNLKSTDSDVSSTYSVTSATRNNTTWSNNDHLPQYTTNGLGDPDYDDKFGYHYSWCAATANTSTTCANIDGETDATSSICPKGWHLPKGGSSVADTPNRNVSNITTMTSNDFAYLRNLDAGLTGTDSSSWSIYALSFDNINSFTLGGAAWYKSGTVQVGAFMGGGFTNYWSRTPDGGVAGAYNLQNYTYNDTTIKPAESMNRYLGLSVRCVAYSS